MTDIITPAETYTKALNRISTDESGKRMATYFGWGIELRYNETSTNVELVNTRYKITHASITSNGTITLTPIATKEELDAMAVDPELSLHGLQKVKYSYLLYLSYQAIEQFFRAIGVLDNSVRIKRDKGNNTFIWTETDESTPIKERKCPMCRGFRKVSGMCYTSSQKDCKSQSCPEAKVIADEIKRRNPYIRVVPPSAIAHDHISVCSHGLTSTHETKLGKECWACSGSGKKIAGGNPRYRKWRGNNTIVINPDFSYAVEPSEVHPEYHMSHWNEDLS